MTKCEKKMQKVTNPRQTSVDVIMTKQSQAKINKVCKQLYMNKQANVNMHKQVQANACHLVVSRSKANANLYWFSPTVDICGFVHGCHEKTLLSSTNN